MEEDENASPSRKRKRESPALENSPSVRRKSLRQEGKRRSSFVRGRISRQLQLPDDSDFSWDIPKDLAEDERLGQLVKLCAQYTIQKLRQEFPDLENFDGFRIQLTDVVDKTVSSAASQGLLKMACFKDKYLPNPVNVEVENTAAQYEEYIQRLEKESSSWETLVSSHEEESKTAILQARSVDDQPLSDIKLSREHSKLLLSSTDLNKLRKEIEKIEMKTELQLDALQTVTDTLHKYNEAVSDFVSQQSKNLRVKSFEGMEKFSDPRKLITNIIGGETSQTGENSPTVKAKSGV